MAEIRESRKIINASVEVWEEKDFKYEVCPIYQERVIIDGVVKEFITHYEVVKQIPLPKWKPNESKNH